MKNQNKLWKWTGNLILHNKRIIMEIRRRMNCISLTLISNHIKRISKSISNKLVKLLNAKLFIKTDVPKEKLSLNI